MDQTLFRLKQLKIGTKRPKKYSSTLISFSNETNMLDLLKHLSRQCTADPYINQLCCILIEESLYKLKITLRNKKIYFSFHYKLHLILFSNLFVQSLFACLFFRICCCCFYCCCCLLYSLVDFLVIYAKKGSFSSLYLSNILKFYSNLFQLGLGLFHSIYYFL